MSGGRERACLPLTFIPPSCPEKNWLSSECERGEGDGIKSLCNPTPESDGAAFSLQWLSMSGKIESENLVVIKTEEVTMGKGRGPDPYRELLRKERNTKARASYQKKKLKKESDDFITALALLPVEIALAPVKAIIDVNKSQKKAKKAQAAKRTKKR